MLSRLSDFVQKFSQFLFFVQKLLQKIVSKFYLCLSNIAELKKKDI